jgi:hypothetical protein
MGQGPQELVRAIISYWGPNLGLLSHQTIICILDITPSTSQQLHRALTLPLDVTVYQQPTNPRLPGHSTFSPS